MLILLLISFPVASCLSSENGVFLGKSCLDRRKNHGCGQKKPEGAISAIFGVETGVKSWELKRCADGVRSRTDNNGWSPKANWTFHLNFSLKLNFSPSTKKTTEYSFAVFVSINKIVFDFCCLCLFCYNAGHHAKNAPKTRETAQGYIKCMPPHIGPLWCSQTDGRTDGRMITWLLRHYQTKFLGLIGYQICLAMVLHWRATLKSIKSIIQYIYCSWNKHPYPCLQFQSCNLIGKSKTLLAEEANRNGWCTATS